jgi:hypothetical protein
MIFPLHGMCVPTGPTCVSFSLQYYLSNDSCVDVSRSNVPTHLIMAQIHNGEKVIRWCDPNPTVGSVHHVYPSCFLQNEEGSAYFTEDATPLPLDIVLYIEYLQGSLV